MRNVWVWIVIIVIILGGGYWWFSTMQPAASTDTGAMTDTEAPADTGGSTSGTAETGTSLDVGVSGSVSSTPTSATVTYNGSGFSPSSVTIKKGGTVTFTSTAGNMWVASGPHPEHTGYDGTSRSQHCASGATSSFDQCVAGSSYSFTFDKVGTWPYHNHLNASVFGKIVVVE